MKFETLEVAGLEPAISGMRNPLKSYDKADSGYHEEDYWKNSYKIGPDDYRLAKNLCQSGPEHRKWMRQVVV